MKKLALIDSDIVEAVKSSNTMISVLIKLGYHKRYSERIKGEIKRLGLSTEHFGHSKCSKCGRDISLKGMPNHAKTCDGSVRIHALKEWLVGDNKYKCPICGKIYNKNGIGYHIWRKHGDGVSFKPLGNGHVAWNKGLTNETDERVRGISEKNSVIIQNKIKLGTFVPGKMSDKARMELSISQSLNNRGGKCKWFEVSGIKVQGTWERDMALKMTELGIVWEKPHVGKDVIEYKIGDIVKRYTPDFYLPDIGTYLEIKGHWWGNDKTKMDEVIKQRPEKKIVIIEKDVYKKIIKSNDDMKKFFWDLGLNQVKAGD